MSAPMTPQEMYDRLKPIQEDMGYYFNPDTQWCLDAIDGLLANKERYGYTSCPCRLAFGDRERDRAIICPCAFRAEDVRTYDTCFCKLYLSAEATEGRRETPEVIPDRWLRK